MVQYQLLAAMKKAEPSIVEAYCKRSFVCYLPYLGDGGPTLHQLVEVDLLDAGPDAKNPALRYSVKVTRRDGLTRSSNGAPTIQEAFNQFNWNAIKHEPDTEK